MARTNKYSSINFNDVYDKKISSPTPTKNHSSKPSSSSSYSSATSPHNALANSPYKGHLTQGRMLVLTRPAPAPAPSPKPIAVPPPQPSPSPSPAQNVSEPDSDPISLRPLGRTGNGSALPSPVPALERDKEALLAVTAPKPEKFVPPHLRPGFAGKEESPGPDGQKQAGFWGGEDGRPRSGGYEGMRRGGQPDLNRTTSFGNRPSSSGW